MTAYASGVLRAAGVGPDRHFYNKQIKIEQVSSAPDRCSARYMLVRNVFTPIRAMLRPVGVELAANGRVTVAEDVYFLTLAEAREAIAGVDMRETVAAHRAEHAREVARRHVPRVLLSDGTDAEVALVEPVEETCADLRLHRAW